MVRVKSPLLEHRQNRIRFNASSPRRRPFDLLVDAGINPVSGKSEKKERTNRNNYLRANNPSGIIFDLIDNISPNCPDH